MTRRLHEPAPPDGWWWVRLSPATPRGADRQWTMCRVLDGAVRPHGSVAWYSPTAKWLRDAEWVAAEPPGPAITEARLMAGDDDVVRRVAGEVVDVFMNLSDTVPAYYRRHPEHLADLVAVVSRIIVKAVR
jgi:hypothetical protein